MTVHLEFLRSLPYFAGLSGPALESIVRYVFQRVAERGEILTFEGERSDVLYFVVEGAVKVFKTSADGKEQIFRIIRPGESFNDVPVLGGGVNLFSAEAMGMVVLNSIKKSDLGTIIQEYPQVAMNIIEVLSNRVQELVALVEDFSFRHVTGRVAKMLLEYALPGNDTHPRLTQQEMASMIGTAREMVGRSLKNLEEEKVIRMERNRIVITNLNVLKNIAGVS